ncbi:MAG: hypothetical protein GY854_27990 [Deltaproteobacteria bacterium]|nr:hypothetical protein [Deltaproteobacteria bacterium]
MGFQGYMITGHEYGIYWADNNNVKWKSGQHSTNPNEIIFVGDGIRRAAISLKDGSAYFNNIKASELVLDGDRWADFVFEDDYNLMPIEEVEKYISSNGHLPDVPKAKKVARDGISIGESQAMLLQKIEELTLYLIAQNKKIQKLEQESGCRN